jgi:hypothetical protein
MAVLLDKLRSNVKVKISYWYKLHFVTRASSTVWTYFILPPNCYWYYVIINMY